MMFTNLKKLGTVAYIATAIGLDKASEGDAHQTISVNYNAGVFPANAELGIKAPSTNEIIAASTLVQMNPAADTQQQIPLFELSLSEAQQVILDQKHYKLNSLYRQTWRMEQLSELFLESVKKVFETLAALQIEIDNGDVRERDVVQDPSQETKELKESLERMLTIFPKFKEQVTVNDFIQKIQLQIQYFEAKSKTQVQKAQTELSKKKDNLDLKGKDLMLARICEEYNGVRVTDCDNQMKGCEKKKKEHKQTRRHIGFNKDLLEICNKNMKQC